MKEATKCLVEVSVDKSQWKTTAFDFLQLGHRHFEKELPESVNKGSKVSDTLPGFYRLPVDLVRMVVPPTAGAIVDSIEEVLLVYDKKK